MLEPAIPTTMPAAGVALAATISRNNDTIKTRPILFSIPMIRAILSGTKTQTRRIVKSPKCPYGQPGDLLWVREAWSKSDPQWGLSVPYIYKADHLDPRGDAKPIKWKPSIHMPRAASRLTLEIVDIRIEQLQSISEQDAIAEGVESPDNSPIESFTNLWNSINSGLASWKANPLVWVVRFNVK